MLRPYYPAAFASAKQADALAEQARLSYVASTKPNPVLFRLNTPPPAQPLYYFERNEVDPSVPSAAAFRVQIAGDAAFSQILRDDTVTDTASYPVPAGMPSRFFLRSKAQGRSHADWGEWSQTVEVNPATVDHWQLFLIPVGTGERTGIVGDSSAKSLRGRRWRRSGLHRRAGHCDDGPRFMGGMRLRSDAARENRKTGMEGASRW